MCLADSSNWLSVSLKSVGLMKMERISKVSIPSNGGRDQSVPANSWSPQNPPLDPLCCYHTLQHPTVGGGRECKWLCDRLPLSRLLFSSWTSPGFSFVSGFYPTRMNDMHACHIWKCLRVNQTMFTTNLSNLGRNSPCTKCFFLLCSCRIRPPIWIAFSIFPNIMFYCSMYWHYDWSKM